MWFLNYLLHLPRHKKRGIQVAFDCVIIATCYLLAMFLRLDSWAFLENRSIWYVLIPVIPVTIFVFIRMGLYRAVLRYIGGQAASTVMIGVLISAVTMFASSQVFGWFVPRSVPAIYALLAMVLIGGIRVIWRGIYAQAHAPARAVVAIYGAGPAGRQVAASLRNGVDYVPKLFVDDDPTLTGSEIAGLKVFAGDSIQRLIPQHGIEIILLAMPQLSRSERQRLLTQLEPLPVQIQTVPDLDDLVSGKATLSDFQDVSVEDLLGRDPVPPRPELLAINITGKSVMVTGAGGSIGSELCRQIIALSPDKLVLLEQSEFNLYRIEQELSETLAQQNLNVALHPVMGSVQHPQRTRAALDRFNVQTVYHAAAYKHVPLIEDNAVEGVRNNIFGTQNLAQAAIAAGVQAFILISTDKAVRPTNIMGATKRMAELVCQALAETQSTTRFSMVRFGNVLGSSGSVIPRFRQQIQAGGPVTVTSSEITRYFMTIPEAAQLVIQAGAMGKGGDVFVLDMGDPVRITDLAQRMIRLSGLTPWVRGQDPEGDIEITFTGLRPGEKLYEELLIADNASQTAHPRICSAQETRLTWPELGKIIDALAAAAEAQDAAQIRAVLIEAPLGYDPSPTVA